MAATLSQGRRAMLLGALILTLGLVGCRGGRPTPGLELTPAAGEATDRASLPAREFEAVMDPAEGGRLALSDGAEVSVPPQGISEKTVVTLRVVDPPRGARIPNTILGRTYQFALEGGSPTGTMLFRLPVPQEMVGDQYEMSAYRWSGESWQRIGGSLRGDTVQFGTNLAGIFALQGNWKLATATLALLRPDLTLGQPSIPLAIAGQYRYSALPALTGDYVPARLSLKQDTSGGLGQIAGDETLDRTVGEAELLFKPDPSTARGVIDFQHVFQVTPDSIALPAGSTTRLYAVLTVEDSGAPTRRLSSGIEYTQILPIQAIGNDVVRPALQDESARPLRWHVQRDGQTFALQDSVGPSLGLTDLLARGGLGEYRIFLEAQENDIWITVSNDVTVLLTLPSTLTPQVAAGTPQPGGTAVAMLPIPGGEASTAQAPATPTRRPTPVSGQPPQEMTATPTPSSLGPTITPTPTRPAWASVFWADRYAIASGECTRLHWDVKDVTGVYLDGAPVTGREDRDICPTQTTRYVLRVTNSAGSQEHVISVQVSTDGQAAFEFTADEYQIVAGSCTTLRWRAIDVRAVFLNGQGVAGESTQQVCPTATTDYELRVESSSGASSSRKVTVTVLAANQVAMRFWADAYTVGAGQCTNLRWNVQSVQSVYLQVDGVEEGVPGQGSRQVCVSGPPKFYQLRAVRADGTEGRREITLDGSGPNLDFNEVVAQGIVSSVQRVTDLDPNTDGEQQGWRLTIDGLNVLFSNSASCCQSAVTLPVPGYYIQYPEGAPVDWPLNPGQAVEFRAYCEGGVCAIENYAQTYLWLRSE